MNQKKPIDFNKLDHNCFRAFWAAAHSGNFTAAAKSTGLTQSGVSQHIARLEKQLGTSLFDRVNKSVRLTSAGRTLVDFLSRYEDSLTELFEKVAGETRALTGKVRYAMPHSCLFTPHFPKILEEHAGFPNIELNVTLCANEEVLDNLLGQNIDFGFLTKRIARPGVKLAPFGEEEYVLVGAPALARATLTTEALRTAAFVDFPGMDSLYEHWAMEIFGIKAIPYAEIRRAGRINSLHGAITMATNGLGFLICPRHCVTSELESVALQLVKIVGAKCAKREIFLASLENIRPPLRVRKVVDAFLKMKTGA